MSGILKYMCWFNQKERYSPLWSVNNFHFKRDGKLGDHVCALHNSESSLSHIGSMETLISAEDKFIVEDNPEVMLDVLTMQSLRDRYNEKDLFEVHLTAPYVNEQDFDNYVREFVIDDTISECFATTEETTSAVAFSKMYNSPVKQNRLKKKLIHKSPQEEMILSDDDSRSSDSKRSKLIGHIFNRKQKGKENLKPIKDVETDENGDITGAIINACEHITKTYKQPNNSGKSETVINEKNQRREHTKSQGLTSNGSISNSDVGRRTSFSGRSRDSSNPRKLPAVPIDPTRSDSSASRRRHSTASSTGISKRTPKKSEALIDELMLKSDNDLATALHDLPYDALRKTRDRYGNTVLHRCVQDDKTTSTRTLSTRYPQMCSELNNDRLSALEYSVKLGKCECMLILLEKSRSDGVLETLTVPRLLNMAAEYDQVECIESLLNLLPKSDSTPLELPPDSLGNTAAHEAASKGHLRCFKVLLENGYDVWSKNSDGLCPIQLAIHNHHTDMYGFMMLYESSRCLAREAVHQFNNATRLKNTMMSNYDAFLTIESQLSRYQEQLNEAMRSTLESQENILVTLDCIYDQLSAVVGSVDDGSELSCHMENIKGESERLQDLFDFSVIANANSLLSKLLTDFREVLKDADAKDSKTCDVQPYNNFRSALSELQSNLVQLNGEEFEENIRKHLYKYIESYKRAEEIKQMSDKDSTTNTSSSTSNRTFTITKKSLKLPTMSTNTTIDNLPPTKTEQRKNGVILSKSQSVHKERKKNESIKVKNRAREKGADTSVEKTRNALLNNQNVLTENKKDENEHNNFGGNDLPIATEHQNLGGNHLLISSDHGNFDENNLPVPPEVELLESTSVISESVYTSTLTSNNTVGDQFSDWTSKSDTLCRDSCDSASEWWNENHGYYEEDDYYDEEQSRVRLNVDNEDLSDDMLRQHRLNQHLKSVEKINCQRNDVIETVVTASGRQLGRSNPSKIPKAAPRLSLHKEPAKQKHESKRVTGLFSKIRNKGKVKLFSVEDVTPSREITQSEFLESYDRSRDKDLKWDEVSLTDAEEYKTDEKPWYEMSEDEESLIPGWKSDDEDEQSRVLGDI